MHIAEMATELTRDDLPLLVVALALSVLGVIGASSVLVWLRRERLRRSLMPGAPLDAKIQMVAELSTTLGKLNAEIKDEFVVQLAETKRLISEAENAKSVAALNDEALKAAESLVASQINTALKKNSKGERGFQIALSAVGFAAGVIVTLILQTINAGAGT